MVVRSLREREVVGSNPIFPTIKSKIPLLIRGFHLKKPIIVVYFLYRGHGGMVDALVSEASGETRGSSSLLDRTKNDKNEGTSAPSFLII